MRWICPSPLPNYFEIKPSDLLNWANSWGSRGPLAQILGKS
jgi:hypothetical protein